MLNRAVARPLALVAVCLATAAGCGEDATRQTAAPASSGAASTASTPASSPAASTSAPATSSAPSTPATTSAAPASPSSAPTSAAPTPAPRGPLGARLLAAGEVPGFNDQYRWRTGTTTRHRAAHLGGHLPALRPDVHRRRRRSPSAPSPRPSAGPRTARSSWSRRSPTSRPPAARSPCSPRGAPDAPTGSGTTDARTSAGWSRWVSRRRHRGLVPAHLRAREGRPRRAVLRRPGHGPSSAPGSRWSRCCLAGQDYNYEAGQEPMVAAVQRAAASSTLDRA